MLIFATALAGGLAAAAAAQEVSSEVTRQGEFISVQATVELPVDRGIAWSVLTDYDSLAQFIPDMEYSRVVLRGPDGLVVEQKGRFGFLFFSRSIEVRLAVIETPPQSVVTRLISGDMRDMAGSYDLQESGSGVKLVYRGRFLPESDLPPLIGPALLRYAINRQFEAMVREILRRDALARGGAGVPQPAAP